MYLLGLRLNAVVTFWNHLCVNGLCLKNPFLYTADTLEISVTVPRLEFSEEMCHVF